MIRTKLILLLVLVATLSACGGGGAKVQNTTTNTTMGRELIDLDESYKKGLLTEKEYKKAKKNIMGKYNN